ncbi:linoleate 13S-lipoxygenase 2-1, chloroplastic-like isoform X1 [Rosa rugosa]|uniref:linoleate 13S-lipoxygenase 2-1, chloroplastic-like isoform X1 n=1 Tax=Rosa rugosa TaxID=74645 RepID=UPI002B40CDCE|nr:linoleate 13S-lipoxygenase 2-1, chloroplastic-like isoform X1 [Rosa rugosa]
MMMMKPQLQKPPSSSSRSSSLLPLKPGSSAILSSPSFVNILPARGHTKHHLTKKYNRIRASSEVKTATANNTGVDKNDTAVTVKAVVTVQETAANILSTLSLTAPLDTLTDIAGKTFLLELVSAELDPKNGLEKETIKGYAHKVNQKETIVTYESVLTIPAGFGHIGAVQVENDHHKEAYIKSIEITGFPNGTSVSVPCNSWTHSKYDNKQKRIFFTNKSYLPSETPSGIKRLREEELQLLRGNGEGERKSSERIYDYDTYNDLGDPDSKDELARPVLGGKDHPYPRRCRTGRPRTKKDPLSEERSSSVYVPRDEAFAELKQLTFSTKTLKSVLHALLPQLEITLVDPELGFPYFTAIDSLFNEGVTLPKPKASGFFQSIIPRLVKAISDGQDDLLLFETPEILDRDKFSWFKDEEFSRQTLAGLNPYSIELVTEWPLKSKLDPEIYGPAESLITTELVENEIRGFMTVNEALKRKKLFILDYHDLLMPYVNKVREVEGTTLYGSRTLFFLNENGTLRPVAIELTRPPIGDKPQWKEVFTPTWDATGCWLWRLAKAHVCAHDSGYHQLVIHWLRTHCCTEPYIIAANRQLSAMHPIYRLLHPHFRYTMEINALAREALINAGGIIETCFSPAKYSIELSSAAYDQLWRFDMEALPADLIRRGMAVEDPTAEHGLKLTIEDYPFANDGLILWDAIKEWVGDYVNHYYPDPTLVESDNELQAWWTEVRTEGHADKKDEPWWPVLKTPEDLIHTLTTIIWVTAGHHAAVNFGQYTYAGYFPNRPTIARSNMPTEDPNEDLFKIFLKKPEAALLRCFPSQIQATKVMAVLDVLSNHSPDEEYIGGNVESSWAENPVINAAFERFNGNLKRLEGIIDERNTNMKLKNRVGAGVVPYELLKPFSEPGVTGKGVPNSISI